MYNPDKARGREEKQERNGGSVDDKKQQQQQREKKVLQSKYATKTSSLRVETPCRKVEQKTQTRRLMGEESKKQSDGRFLLFLGNDRRVM